MLGPDTICLTHLQIVNKIERRYQIQPLQISNYKFDLNLSKNQYFFFNKTLYFSVNWVEKQHIKSHSPNVVCLNVF